MEVWQTNYCKSIQNLPIVDVNVWWARRALNRQEGDMKCSSFTLARN